MGLVPLRDLQNQNCQNYASPSDLDEISKKGGNQETQSTAAQKKKERKKDRTCGGVKGSAGGR